MNLNASVNFLLKLIATSIEMKMQRKINRPSDFPPPYIVCELINPAFNNQSQARDQFFLANKITPTNTAPRATTAPPIRKGLKLSNISQPHPPDSVAPCWSVAPSAGFSGSVAGGPGSETGSGFGGGAASFFSALEADFGAPLAFASMWECDRAAEKSSRWWDVFWDSKEREREIER